MRRMTILGLMGSIALCGIGIAALRNADELWQGIAVTTALACVGVSILGAIQTSGRQRAWFIGFCLFCGGYLVLTYSPWFHDEVEPKLLTGQFLRYIRNRARDQSITIRTVQREIVSMQAQEKRLAADASPAMNNLNARVQRARLGALEGRLQAVSVEQETGARWRAFFPGAKNAAAFLQIGHCLCALMLGVVGATLSVRFYRHRDSAKTRTHAHAIEPDARGASQESG